MANETVESFLGAGMDEKSNWRSIVLFGRNVASYKFALAKSLIDLANEGRDSVTLEELAAPYARHLCEHVAHSPRQATNRSSKFVDACKAHNEGSISTDQLICTTAQIGFNNVLDAFHVVNQNDVPLKFFEKDFTRQSKRITLTDSTFKIASSAEAASILQETESRWNLVETAWKIGISSNLLAYDEERQQIIVDNGLRRRDVTSARGALNGYQKGRCFYCFTGISSASEDIARPSITFSNEPPKVEYAVISLDDNADDCPEGETAFEPCDVDHFFPRALGRVIRDINFDGAWNLVLACRDCNRGEDGKFARIPDLRYLDRLYRRNEYLILSHHPLRESLIAQTGPSPQHRLQFLKRVDSMATELLPGVRWSTEQRAAASF